MLCPYIIPKSIYVYTLKKIRRCNPPFVRRSKAPISSHSGCLSVPLVCAIPPLLLSKDFLQAQHAPNAVANRLLVLVPALAPHLGSLNVGGTLIVWLGQHAHDGDEDLFDGLDGRPALRGVFVVVGVVAGRVEDGDADEAAGVDCDFMVSTIVLTLFLFLSFVIWGDCLCFLSWFGQTIPFGCHMSARNFIDGGASG